MTRDLGVWTAPALTLPQCLNLRNSRTARAFTFPAELLTHAVRPEAIANVIAFLADDLAAPVSGAIVPAFGA